MFTIIPHNLDEAVRIAQPLVLDGIADVLKDRDDAVDRVFEIEKCILDF